MRRSFSILIFSLLCLTLVLSVQAAGPIPRSQPAGGSPVVINELLADTGAGDANGDGDTSSTSEDEFVEIINISGATLDLSNWKISDALSDRHVFPAGTVVRNGCAVLIFGGGEPSGVFGGSVVQTASNGSLNLNNTGDTVTLKDSANTVIAAYTYGSEGGDDQSLTRSPDVTGPEPLIQHTLAPGANGAVFSPGVQIGGDPFDEACLTIDLALSKTGPASASPGDAIDYTLSLLNQSELDAAGVVVTDTLPTGVTYLSDTSGRPLTQPSPGVLVWTVGDLNANDDLTWDVAVQLDETLSGEIENQAEAHADGDETNLDNNHASAVTFVAGLVINEILADGNAGDANNDGVVNDTNDEFVEMVNNTGQEQDLEGWTLSDASAVQHVFPAGTLLSPGCAVLLFGGGTPSGSFGGSLVQTADGLSLNNTGDTVTLATAQGDPIASYTYGSEGGADQSLTRDPDIFGPTLIQHTLANGAGGAIYSPGVQVNGAIFQTGCVRPDLNLVKTGPATVPAGAEIVYTLDLTNPTQAEMPGVTITDTLPAGLTYVSDSSGLPLTQPEPGVLVWSAGDVAAGGALNFTLRVQANPTLNGTVVNQAAAGGDLPEATLDNNLASHTTVVGQIVVISAVLYDGQAANEQDEAVQLFNVGAESIDLSGWKINDGGSSKAVLPASVVLDPGQSIWLTQDEAAFTAQFGFAADYAMSDLTGTWPGFANTDGSGGDEVLLLDPNDGVVDTLVYGGGSTATTGWSGAAVQPYGGTSKGEEGQILYRQLDQTTGQIVPDTDQAQDWAQWTGDVINGRKVRYPGWDLESFFFPMQSVESASLTVAIAPDNAFEAVLEAINSAQDTIQMESLTFTNLALMEALIEAAERGVSVTVLLDGSPAGGLPDQEKALCQMLEAAPGASNCWFMINDDAQNISARYAFLHAKFMLIDGEQVVISTENMSPNSLPYDDQSDGTAGRRGVVLITDAPQVIAHLQAIFDADFDPDHHQDITPWDINDPVYGAPPIGFVPSDESGGITYTVRYPEPVTYQGTFQFEIVQSPESSLRDQDSLLGLIAQAGAGDTILVEQLDERPYWGENAVDDPSPRMEAYLDAARRGAEVWILLDSYHADLFFQDPEDPANNVATCAYVRDVARAEQLRVRCAVHNPTGFGIHAKIVLAEIDGRGYIHVGSLNGTENASKANREVALQVQSDAAYALLAEMFTTDWPHRAFAPFIGREAAGRADHLLISEIHYNPSGTDDNAEFIEIVNPTANAIGLTNYRLGDSNDPAEFEDVRIFPAGATIASLDTVVVARQASTFLQTFGFLPDYEILSTDATVPDMLDDPAWDPEQFLQLGNSGDEVFLKNSAGQIVDVVTYGTGSFSGVTPVPINTSTNSLQRVPYYVDTNDGVRDFQQRTPTPGALVVQ